MAQPDDPKLRPVFMMGEAEDGSSLLIMGITDVIIEMLKSAPGVQNANIDLTKMGIPLRVIVIYDKDQATLLSRFRASAAAQGIEVDDTRGKRHYGIEDK